mmetsp:Transcript_8602/g.14945  ORF Transcript_8602/g.14945 Transcript_8602/m.14945 type:complete len:122 (-) Transcript_8602:17-382(-)
MKSLNKWSSTILSFLAVPLSLSPVPSTLIEELFGICSVGVKEVSICPSKTLRTTKKTTKINHHGALVLLLLLGRPFLSLFNLLCSISTQNWNDALVYLLYHELKCYGRCIKGRCHVHGDLW